MYKKHTTIQQLPAAYLLHRYYITIIIVQKKFCSTWYYCKWVVYRLSCLRKFFYVRV